MHSFGFKKARKEDGPPKKEPKPEPCGGCGLNIVFATPLRINMEHNHGGLEDHFAFRMGDL